MSVEVRTLTVRDLDEVARIHMTAFQTSALTVLGEQAVRRYYDWLLVGPHQTTALGAFVEDRLVAFLFGGTFHGALTGFLHRNRRFLVGLVARRPTLLGTPLVRGRVLLAIKLLWRRVFPAPPPPRSTPAFGVLSIAALPQSKSHGAAHALMMSAEDIARATFTRMELTVADSNVHAIRFYERGGWHKVLIDGVWKEGLMRKELAS